MQAPGRDRVQLRRRGDIRVDRIDVVARPLEHASPETAGRGQRLIVGILEPCEQQALALEGVGLADQARPLIRRKAQQPVEQLVRECRQKCLATLSGSGDAGQLKGLERGLSRRDRRRVVGHVDWAGDLQQLVDRVGRDPEHPVDLLVAGLIDVQPEGVLGARGKVG